MSKHIIALWGGPGAGKSTTCAAVFAELKHRGFNTEMNREYVKDWVWEERKIRDGDQVYITAKTARKEAQYIRNGLDFIVTDSPLALTVYYGNIYDKYEQQHQACKQIIKQHHQLCIDHGYKVDHFLLTRVKAYNPLGRYQTEEQARAMDGEIKAFLAAYPIKYTEVDAGPGVVEEIISRVIR